MKILTINEHGEIFTANAPKPIESLEICQTILQNTKLTETYRLETHFENENYLIEAFDHPLMVLKLIESDGKIFVETQYQLTFEADINKFSLDPFDRICGMTTRGCPFRLTEKAQDQLFDSCDEFDDESFTLNNLKVETPDYYIDQSAIGDSDFWNEIYKNSPKPNWDIGQAAPVFQDMLPRLKLPKSRILVLGSGEGHDAALFAQAGHVVTAVDFSPEAIRKAKLNYGDLENLNFVQADVFNLPHEWNATFDVIIEHTCFCAIEPHRRKELVKTWRRLLHEEGQLMGLFFSMLKRPGPPYGSSEWEIRELLQHHFQFLFWGRWNKSVEKRQGLELFVLAKKK